MAIWRFIMVWASFQRAISSKGQGKAEVGVQIVQRWVLAALRKRQFFSLADLNEAILELVQKLNQRPFRKLAGSRPSCIRVSIDRVAAAATASVRVCGVEKGACQSGLSHRTGGHYYSTPYQLSQGGRCSQHERTDRG